VVCAGTFRLCIAGCSQREPAISNKPAKIPEWLKPWIEAKKRHRLSQTHIQMARELGMNPRKFGKLDNHRQEPWKAPLPIFIETIYFKRFGKERPDHVRSFVEMAAAEEVKKRAKKLKREAKKAARAAGPAEDSGAAQFPQRPEFP
jgi:hypothetical protein